jgi:hypothetical protein
VERKDCENIWHKKGSDCDRQGKSIAQATTCVLAEPAIAVIAKRCKVWSCASRLIKLVGMRAGQARA